MYYYSAYGKYIRYMRQRSNLLIAERNVDEQTVPFKGFLGIKQYIKMGKKLFLPCGRSGTIYDLIVYHEASTALEAEYMFFGQGPSVFLQLSERIPRHSKLFIDNYLYSYWLFHWLFKNQICEAEKF